MNYQQTLEWIHSFKANGRRPDLRRMAFLLENSGNPQQNLAAVHVVGTNGKGSVTSFLQHIFSKAAYKTGTFTSPFITRFNERLAINGEGISDEELIRLTARVRPTIEKLQRTALGRPTEFEVLTFMMFVYFGQVNPVDIAIIEAGIGGLRDSTNVFKALALVCPSISKDHTETLGKSLTEIARQKLGALDEGVPLIFGPMTDDVRPIFYQTAQQLQSTPYEFGEDFSILEKGRTFDFTSPRANISDIHLKMLGRHQKINASLAAMTGLILSSKFPRITPSVIKSGLQSAVWPGRSELIADNLLLDGAHNEDSIKKLIQLLTDEFPDKTIHILFAGLKRKPLETMLDLLAPFDLTLTTFSFYEAEQLENYPQCYPTTKDYRTWLKRAEQSEDLFVVTGSLYFISEIRNYLLKKTRLS
ncbi:bifunctional folylpolyglutamate synthase/dihydrofolate synthase [Streptococcus caviae]|uniref:bifunctional folylpolyglutamate synthase/dihydrofolate synthase n=1 Tax=Streptococcus sp. 'caviae' TaxID=1915004 RepID=UPI00094B9ADA|nr:folylpolyglutamate synthase/dihydrofolate synthase family protein [Streptococcus sp. 'caviae']OLN83816.1 dihydrofolate synthase [Streptococcus sp. 'caviae']